MADRRLELYFYDTADVGVSADGWGTRTWYWGDVHTRENSQEFTSRDAAMEAERKGELVFKPSAEVASDHRATDLSAEELFTQLIRTDDALTSIVAALALQTSASLTDVLGFFEGNDELSVEEISAEFNKVRAMMKQQEPHFRNRDEPKDEGNE